MNSSENDDYWNKSDLSKFNFEPDDNATNDLLLLEDAVDSTANIKTESSYIPTNYSQNYQNDYLANYLSENCINRILDSENEISDLPVLDNLKPDEKIRILQRKLKERWLPPSVEGTIERILLGQSYSLELYHSLSSKKKLLKRAVDLGDGDALLAIVVHFSKVLKRCLFHQLLNDYPSAASHYIHYLFMRRQMQELSDVLEVLGRSKEIPMKYLAVAGENPHRLLQRLKFLLKIPSIDSSDHLIIENYSKLVEWQLLASEKTKNKSIIGESAVQTIKFASLQKLSLPLVGDDSKTESQPNYLAKCLGIHEKQSLMVSIRANAELNQWENVEKLLIVKGWVGGRKLSTTLPVDRLLRELQKYGASTGLLDDILMLVDVDKRIEAGRKLGRHTVVIETFCKKKDKAGLLQYMAYLDTQSADYNYAETMLRSLGPIKK